MVKYLIFDLDGVLVDFRELHEEAFIQAWNTINPLEFHITKQFHSIYLEARSTQSKLGICKYYFGDSCITKGVYVLKQEITDTLLQKAKVYTHTKELLEYAYNKGYKLICCSNSIRSTIEKSLIKLVPSLSYFTLILSNEDVEKPKPNPEIYLKAIELLGCEKEECLVFEDSIVGQESARKAGLTVIPIIDAKDLRINLLKHSLQYKERKMAERINIVIPMAGLGSRFQKKGYSIPKPFLPVFGTPMFKWVIENIMDSNYKNKIHVHIIVREEHRNSFEELKNSDQIHIYTVPSLTEGAACTVLSVKDQINNDDPLIVANSDQYLEWDSSTFYTNLLHPDYDGVISCFENDDPSDLRWSYTNVDSDGFITNVAEKEFIGPLATTGIYGYKRGSDFVRDAEQMIKDNIRVNNEFYVCPVYNTSISRGLKIVPHNCKKMWGLGVPSDYEYFLSNWKHTSK
jgi:HAD superfamily hydrolase (TIGR01509 family)